MDHLYQHWHATTWGKISAIAFIIIAGINLSGVELPHSVLGTLVSGGFIPLLNILVAIKVILGSWAVTLLFIHYRSLL